MSTLDLFDLPKTITVGGVKYALRTGFKAVRDVLIACNDPELDDEARTVVMFEILLPEWTEIPPEHLEEAGKKLVDFIDCGQKDDGKAHPRVIDWEQDAGLIISAVNNVAHVDIRTLPELHWWTFFSYFMEIRESLLSNVLSIRQKKAKGKKLEKYEEEFYRENRAMIDLKKPETDEIRAEKENILKYL